MNLRRVDEVHTRNAVDEAAIGSHVGQSEPAIFATMHRWQKCPRKAHPIVAAEQAKLHRVAVSLQLYVRNGSKTDPRCQALTNGFA